MQLISWRYNGLKRRGTCRRPAENWAFSAPCFTAGKIDMSITEGMGFTRDGSRGNEDARSVGAGRTGDSGDGSVSSHSSGSLC